MPGTLRTLLRRVARFAVVLLVAVLAHAPRPASALEIEFSGRPVKRDILALYDGQIGRAHV